MAVDLHIGHRLATRAHGDAVAVVHQLIGQLLGVLLSAVLAAGDAGDDQPGLAVLADQCRRGRRRRGPRRVDVSDMGRRLELADEVGADGAGGWTLDAGVGGDGDDHLHVALIEHLGLQPSRLPRLTGWILETACGQALGYRDAKDARADHDQQCDRDDPPRRRDAKSSDPV